MQNKPEEMGRESQNTQGLTDFVEKFVFILRAIGSQCLFKQERGEGMIKKVSPLHIKIIWGQGVDVVSQISTLFQTFTFNKCNYDGSKTGKKVKGFKCFEEVNFILVVYGRRGEIIGWHLVSILHKWIVSCFTH